jgi:hypothetical protein
MVLLSTPLKYIGVWLPRAYTPHIEPGDAVSGE